MTWYSGHAHAGSSPLFNSAAYAIWSDPKSIAGEPWVEAILIQAKRVLSLMELSMLSAG